MVNEPSKLSLYYRTEFIMKTVDCYDLLTRDQREQIADMMMEAMAFHNIYPDIWEMKVEAIIDSEDRPQEAE